MIKLAITGFALMILIDVIAIGAALTVYAEAQSRLASCERID